MKIALITPYENFPGGVESVNTILTNIFVQAGHSVKLITIEDCEVSNISRFMVKVIGLPYLTFMKFKGDESEYDIILANGEYGFGINHPKVINLFHGCSKGYRDYIGSKWGFVQYLQLTRGIYIQRASANGKYVVCVSKFIKSILEADGIKVNQVISNCVDTDSFRPIDNKVATKYLFVGSYNYYAKGFDILEKIADLGLKIDCVTNREPSSKLGWVEGVANSEMPKLYGRYSILIFPSRFEGMPMVPLEAMSCGLPVVMSNVGLGPELREYIPEFVVDGFDEQEYVDKVKHIETDYEKYAEKARAYIEKYHSYEVYKTKWLKLVERVADA